MQLPSNRFSGKIQIPHFPLQISSMASTAPKSLLLQTLTLISSISLPTTFTSTVVEDLNNLQPPPDFNATLTNNCRTNPSLRYCNCTPFNLPRIFKSTIVASHLCMISRNPNCVETFPKIDLRSHPKIAPLYISFTFFWEYCPLSILSIDLSNNSLDGNFPIDILHCSQIRGIDLSLNNFSGEVPVEKLSSMENLTFLNLSYNDFSECGVSETRFLERFNSSSFLHSGVLPDHGVLRMKKLGFLVFSVAILVCFGWICFCRERNRFTPSVLEEACGGFSKKNLVLRSGKIRVYRGVLRDEREVRIEVYLEEMKREKRRRFVNQSKILVRLDHGNIAPVLGWCDSRRFMAVVSEWTDGEDMDTWLKASNPPWKKRVEVILAVGCAVRYLHEEWPEVGYNLKSRNVLVSEKGEPIISRFEFDDHHHSISKKIFEFGVMVLEIVTSRRAEDFGEKEGGFVEWVKVHYEGDLVDRRMKTTAEMVKFGLVCADLSRRRQPSWSKFCEMMLNISHKHVHHTHH